MKPCRIKQRHNGVLSTHQHRYLRTSQDDTLRTLRDQALDNLAIRQARRLLDAPQAQLFIDHPMNQRAVLTAVDSRTNPASTAGTAQHDLDLVSG